MTEQVKAAAKKSAAPKKAAAPKAAQADVNPVVAAGKAQLEQLTKVYEDLVVFSKQNLEAVNESSTKAGEAAQTLANEISEFLKGRFDDSVAAAKALQSVSSVKEAVDLNVEFAKTSYESLIAEVTKLRDILPELTKDVVEPLQSRLTVAVEKFVKREAA